MGHGLPAWASAERSARRVPVRGAGSGARARPDWGAALGRGDSRRRRSFGSTSTPVTRVLPPFHRLLVAGRLYPARDGPGARAPAQNLPAATRGCPPRQVSPLARLRPLTPESLGEAEPVLPSSWGFPERHSRQRGRGRGRFPSAPGPSARDSCSALTPREVPPSPRDVPEDPPPGSPRPSGSPASPETWSQAGESGALISR